MNGPKEALVKQFVSCLDILIQDSVILNQAKIDFNDSVVSEKSDRIQRTKEILFTVLGRLLEE